MRSKRITRQITKALGPELAEENLPVVDDAAALASLREKLWENIPEFFANVDKMYEQLEEKAELASRSLEISSNELGETNRRLFSLNQTFDAILNSLGRGFLLLGRDGHAQAIYSKACESLLEGNPNGRHLGDILRVADAKRPGFNDWYELLFQELMDFEDLAPLGPKFYEHSRGLVVQLEFKPVRDPGGKIEFVLLIATDLTKEVQATERAKKMQAYANLVTSILQNKARFRAFVADFRERIEQCARLTADPAVAAKAHAELKSLLHGLKGGSGLFGLYQVERRIHAAESAVIELQSEGRSLAVLTEDLRQTGAAFERLLDENKEVLSDVLADGGPTRTVSVDRLAAFADLLAERGGEALRQSFVDEFLAEPAFTLVADFNADLRQTAKLLGKSMHPICFEGDNIPLVREAYADLFADMIHVFRNIVDHGIEMPSARTAAGKDRSGTVRVQIKKLSDSFFELCISDDGAGIDEKRLAEKLALRGIRDLGRNELLDSIFRADVSTSEKITAISGRGIGLYAVRERVKELGGEVHVTSEAGRGTRFHFRLPILSWVKR